jgi:hypothetical protein
MKISIDKYEFHPGETGLFVEIYLPKKAEYQGALYEALTDGFNIRKVRNHFRVNGNGVKRFLRDHRINQYLNDSGIRSLVGVFRGYSMYEVDGVFYDKGQISEERTQVIRLIFRVELDLITCKDPSTDKTAFVKDFLRFTGRMDDLLEYWQQSKMFSSRAEARRVFNQLRRWVGEAALFTFGYVLFKICYVMEDVNKRTGRNEESVIWVTSFWNLVLDRVVKVRI